MVSVLSTGICENIPDLEKIGVLWGQNPAEHRKWCKNAVFSMILAASDQFCSVLAQLTDIGLDIVNKSQSIGPVAGGGF